MGLRALRCIVTGATGAVGRSLVTRLVEADARVVAVVRDPDRLRERLGPVADELAAVEVADARDPEGFEDALVAAAGALGTVDGIAHLVGGFMLATPGRTSLAQFEELVRLNLTSAFAAVRVAERAMGSRGGSVVLISSAAAHVGLASHEAVAASKAGIEGLVRSAAATLARAGVRVNAIAPGLVDAEMTSAILEREDARAASIELHALGRIGTGDEIARGVAFLLDPESSWITGSVLSIDGGLGSVRPRPRRRLPSQTGGQG